MKKAYLQILPTNNQGRERRGGERSDVRPVQRRAVAGQRALAALRREEGRRGRRGGEGLHHGRAHLGSQGQQIPRHCKGE